VGRSSKFRRALTRRPIDEWTPRASGPHQTFSGIQPVNIHPYIFEACNAEDGTIDVNTYEKLHSVFTLDHLLDILEMREVARSWADAMLANSQQGVS